MSDVLEQALRDALGTPDTPVVAIERRTLATNQSILTALCARYTGFPVGLHRYAVTRRARSGSERTLDLFVKVKPADTVLIAAGSELAEQCAPGLGALYATYSPQRELGGSHLREAAIYQLHMPSRLDSKRLDSNRLDADQPDMPAVSDVMPVLHAAIIDRDKGLTILALEHLSEVEFLADMSMTDYWTQAHWHAAIDAVARLHAQWLGQEAQILAQPWISANASGPGVLAMMPWWQALGRFAAADFTTWLGEDASTRYESLRMSMSDWWGELCAMPRTLIHNDFNPRNLAFRITGGGPAACLFDWELATLGVPQHDLAELLCFALPANADAAWVEAMIARHRERLLTNLKTHLPSPAAWRRGVTLCLNHLFIDRLPMYLLIHKLKPLPYLPRVLHNWQRLNRWLQP